MCWRSPTFWVAFPLLLIFEFWVKVKCLNREEFVVVGWTDPEVRVRGSPYAPAHRSLENSGSGHWWSGNVS